MNTKDIFISACVGAGVAIVVSVVVYCNAMLPKTKTLYDTDTRKPVTFSDWETVSDSQVRRFIPRAEPLHRGNIPWTGDEFWRDLYDYKRRAGKSKEIALREVYQSLPVPKSI